MVEQEAEVVRQAFYMAGMCHTYSEIAKELTRMERANGTERVRNNTPVVNLLRSEMNTIPTCHPGPARITIYSRLQVMKSTSWGYPH